MSHFVEKCKICKDVMTQCRCASKDKEVRWGLCSNCQNKMNLLRPGVQVVYVPMHADDVDHLDVE